MIMELELEADGRWLAEAPKLPGCLAYGATPEAARRRCIELALRILADRAEHGEALPPSIDALFRVAA